MADRYVCIHGHFYQPPRENPWLEAVEIQDSAYPYHDWNERITAECYAPNTAARIVDVEGRITGIVNNYENISFNFGPTLLSWLEDQAPNTYESILHADRQSRERFGGHGSAIAQAYNHVILPLANDRDKQTQVLWGARDFDRRFGRRPEGMWLPETAVDLETLDVLARAGIRYTMLAPHQARRVRRRDDRNWHEVPGGRVDPSLPYVVNLPSGRQISVFFYDGPISQSIAFGGLLDNGEGFARRLAGAFSSARPWPQIIHIATDGETYGHHHRHGDMALAYAIDYIERNNLAKITNYAQFLERHPAEWEAEIVENSAWSCSHGVERWRSDCGCNSGGQPSWNQRWRTPLRGALDWLRDEIEPHFEARGREVLRDPWQARDEFIDVILDRSAESVHAFLTRHGSFAMDEQDRTRALKLLEMQRHAMLMYTSCGWFFDDLSGIETVQVIQYAGRVVQLASETLGLDLEKPFMERLAAAHSNVPNQGNGAQIYEREVKSAAIDLRQVAGHYSVSSFFEAYEPKTQVYCYSTEALALRTAQSGDVRLALGHARITSQITWETADLVFAVLHFGNLNLSGGVGTYGGEAAFQTLVTQALEAFDEADLPRVIRVLDRALGELNFSIQSLFRDEQRKVVGEVLRSALEEAENSYRQVFERHAPLARFLTRMGAKPPEVFRAAAAVVLNNDLHATLVQPTPDPERVKELVSGAMTWGVELDRTRLSHALAGALERSAEQLKGGVNDTGAIERMEAQLGLVAALPFEVDLWQVQNVYHEVIHRLRSRLWLQSEQSEGLDPAWLERFVGLGEKLGLKVPEMEEVRSVPSFAEFVSQLAGPARVPRSTYRLQFGPTFTFREASDLVAYLDDLGISDAYVSPIFKAGPGSTHGYDVTDHSQVNPELGGQQGFDAFAGVVRGRGMGVILDIVPNHMGIGHTANTLWSDVLENGPASIYAPFFDIDWHPVKPELANKVLLPILDDQYGNVLESGKLRLTYEDGGFYLTYYDFKLPLDPRTYGELLELRLPSMSLEMGEDNDNIQELRSILTALSYLPETSETAPERVAERNREKEVVKRRLAALFESCSEIRAAVEEALQVYNGTVGDASSFDRLDSLLSRQAFRPAYWRVAAEEINYRRFFDVNNLAAVRVELPEVLAYTHQMVFRLLDEGKVTGLRVDHPDGLWDPASYFFNLQERFVQHLADARMTTDGAQNSLHDAVRSWFAEEVAANAEGRRKWPLYVVAEKILGDDEQMDKQWAVHGTTGYDFLNSVGGLFVDERHGAVFERIYSQFIQVETNYAGLVNSSKKMIMLVSLASEINGLSHAIERLSERNRRYRDFTRNSLTFAIREIIAGLPVYRTYVTGDQGASERDEAHVQHAVAEAKRRNPRTAESIFDFLGDTLLLRNLNLFVESDRPSVVTFVMKFQQVTGPVAAKGVEDTAFYIYNRLVSLNEVGGNPQRFGNSISEFHRANLERARDWPHSMLGTSTHDTKRSEDVRSRIDVLSEIPSEWRAAIGRWSEINADKKQSGGRSPVPGRNDEYLLYETLVGAWPNAGIGSEEYEDFVERMVAYMLKAAKEAKAHTSWVNANEAYDSAVQNFTRRLLTDDPADPFLADFIPFQRRVAYFGRFNSLSQVLLKLTSPGVPDIYRGTEMWDYSLVDPDNRRPVDYARYRAALANLRSQIERAGNNLAPLARELLVDDVEGRIKMYVIFRTLGLRRAQPKLFDEGEYHPLRVIGRRHNHLCAFARKQGESSVIVAAPRLVVGLTDGVETLPLGPEVWGETVIQLADERPGARYRNIFTGEVVVARGHGGRVILSACEVLSAFPVALLERLSQS